jgi:hypothetical protein
MKIAYFVHLPFSQLRDWKSKRSNTVFQTLLPLVAGIFSAGIANAASPAPQEFSRVELSEIRSSVVQMSALPSSSDWHVPMIQEHKQPKSELEEEQEIRSALAATRVPQSTFGQWLNIPSPVPASMFLAENQAFAADAVGAVSSNQVLTVTNLGISVQDHAGNVLRPLVSQNAFFNGALPPLAPEAFGHFVFDPRAHFDPDFKRFVITYAYDQHLIDGGLAYSGMLVAISQSSDATSLWNLYHINTGAGATRWADYPMLGVSKDLILISISHIGNGVVPYENLIYGIPKESAFLGSLQIFQTRLALDPDLPSLWHPALNSDENGVVLFGNYGFGTKIARIARGANSMSFTPTTSTLNSPVFTGSNYSAQLGGPVLCGTGYYYASIAQNILTLSSGTGLPFNDGYLPGVRIWDVNSTTLQTIQITDLDGRNEQRSFCLASARKNTRGDLLVGFSTATPLSYLSTGHAVRLASDPSAAVRLPTINLSGAGFYPHNRFGDYSATVLAPNGLDFWTIQMAAGGASPAPPKVQWAKIVTTSGVDLALEQSNCYVSGANLICPIQVVNQGPDSEPEATVNLSSSSIVQRCTPSLIAGFRSWQKCTRTSPFGVNQVELLYAVRPLNASCAIRLQATSSAPDYYPNNNRIDLD